MEINISEKTFKRLSSLLRDISKSRTKNMDYDDLINDLINTYEQNNWDQDHASGG